VLLLNEVFIAATKVKKLKNIAREPVKKAHLSPSVRSQLKTNLIIPLILIILTFFFVPLTGMAQEDSISVVGC
jgi:hypothetical protein